MSNRYKGAVISATPPTVNLGEASGIWTPSQQAVYQAAGTWPAVTFPVLRSLRFNSADSAYLNRTPASAGDRKTWTMSFWVKLGDLTKSGTSGWNTIFGAYTDNNNRLFVYTRDNTNGNVFQIFNNTSGSTNLQLVSNQLFRDASAWYHFVVALDTTQATSADRCKVYVNGSQITSWATATYPSQNADLFFNNNNVHLIGANYFSGLSLYHDGYLTEINFIDGQALTPSSFGATNATTGVWGPIGYDGTYGTNGFYLPFVDNSGVTATTLGKDYSGNGNNWTPNNFSVTAGAGNDSLVDSPSSFGTDTGAGGEVRGNYCTWNPLRNAATLTNGNLDISGPSNAVNSFATVGLTSGKWYWEVTIGSVQNTFYPGIGVNTNLSLAPSSQSGADAVGYMYLADGQKFNSNVASAYGASFTTNDVIGVALDMDAGTITFYKNGSTQGQAFSGITGTAVPVVISWTSSTCFGNFGQRPFAYTAPSGFKALCTTNLPDPTVVQGDDYFNTVLWTGDNVDGRAITGVGFAPDFAWIKSRSAAYVHALQDTVRGAGAILFSNLTNAEDTSNGGGSILSFDSDGFSLDNGTVNNTYVNNSGTTYVAWNWNAGGSNATNTDGTITSTVRANPTAGFSIVSYTGVGPGSAANEIEVGHGLGAIPKMVIVKVRSTTNNWFVFTTVIDGSNDFLYLNTTDAAGNSGNTAPTSDVFYAGGTLNTSSATYIAYCFAEIPGFSAFGKYTGNGSADGPFVYTGFRPAWVLIKRTSATDSWVLYDVERSTYNVVGTLLSPDTSGAEATVTSLDIVSNGFKIRGTLSNINESSNTYIYAAFAENPFKYALAR